MKSRQVFVVWTHPLFYTSLRLILDDPNINLMSAASDYAAAHAQIMSLQPDTIIVEEGGEDISTEVMALLQICPSGGRIIGLNLIDNQLSVYHREHRIVGEAEDLLHLIQSD